MRPAQADTLAPRPLAGLPAIKRVSWRFILELIPFFKKIKGRITIFFKVIWLLVRGSCSIT